MVVSVLLKKLICIVISVIFVVSLCGCKSNSTDTSSTQNNPVLPLNSKGGKEINLLYSYGDTFNPYTATTASNRQLSTLLFDSLVKTDNNFEPILVLAQSVQNEGKMYTVKLRDAFFSDGSPITSSDVIYSYNIAKESSHYSHNFYEVTTISASDNKTVVFNLSQNDEHFVNLLDFPILKSDTSNKFDADGKEITPIGCGRYTLSEDSLSLVRNPNYYGKKSDIKTIHLINSPDSTSTSHYVEIGATAIYYTEGDNIVRMSGEKSEVNLNRFIYIGVNAEYGSLQSKEMRYAISSALDRDAICQSAYYNNAMSATGFFNPKFKATQALQTIESKPNSKITVENLSKIGYNNLNTDGFYANSAGNNPVFTLLVNSENPSRVAAANLISAQCKSAGIEINVIECTYEQYVQRLQSGAFQLYLGEVQVLDNMDFSQLVISGGSAAYGVANSKSVSDTPSEESSDTQSNPPQQTNGCEQIISKYCNGECGIGDVAGTLLTEMPQIPVCYLNGVLFYTSNIVNGVEASTSDIYLSIENYEF